MNHPYNDYTADEDEIEVELAGPWERIGATIINNIFTVLAFIPLGLGLSFAIGKSYSSSANDTNVNEIDKFSSILEQVFTNQWVVLGFVIGTIYTIAQLYYMSRYGQSFGKKLLNLKVIKINGEDAGFVHVILLREIAFYIACQVVSNLLVMVLDTNVMLQILINYLPTIICVIMLFVAAERRTLQDLLAGTVVIKLPRTQKIIMSIKR